ncbi:5000_t:CDS:2 [Racocetra fulgida]|uniref:5000_t:CDS:1 n=1 Tax=Racocetra fulgida TaxID=60492 RepID=A0A9N9A8R5_9GLOM|nr:5000_t:CDS:2 [Racocetra fulgida]
MDVFGNTQFPTPEIFAQTFALSPQSLYAEELYTNASTPNSLGILPDNTNFNDPIFLETSLKPYTQGSSVSHVSYTKYSNTSDFLMKFLAEKGLSLKQNYCYIF